MLDQLGWESLETRRVKQQLITMYKITHNLIDVPAHTYLTPSTSTTRSAHSYKYQVYATSTDTFKFSYFPRTIRTWNQLPASIAEASSLASFRKELDTQTF